MDTDPPPTTTSPLNPSPPPTATTPAVAPATTPAAAQPHGGVAHASTPANTTTPWKTPPGVTEEMVTPATAVAAPGWQQVYGAEEDGGMCVGDRVCMGGICAWVMCIYIHT